MSSDALIVGPYRYWLSRYLGSVYAGPGGSSPPPEDTVVFVMLNPSTADVSEDDPTIRRCMGYARAWGFARLMVVNLFAFRATDAKLLRTAEDPVGPENDRHILNECRFADLVVCAWGCSGGRLARDRGLRVRKMLEQTGKRLYVLRLSKPTTADPDGRPVHPLFQKADLQPTPWPDLEPSVEEGGP